MCSTAVLQTLPSINTNLVIVVAFKEASRAIFFILTYFPLFKTALTVVAFSINELTYIFQQNNILNTVQQRWHQMTLDTTRRLLNSGASNPELN